MSPIFLAPLLLVPLGLLVLISVSSQKNKNTRRRLLALIQNDVASTIENVKVYGKTATGGRNNFPDHFGWTTATLFIADNFILMTVKSKLPFVFRGKMEPFVISYEPSLIMARLRFSRVYKPFDVHLSDYGRDLTMAIKPAGIFSEMKIELFFERIGKKGLDPCYKLGLGKLSKNCWQVKSSSDVR